MSCLFFSPSHTEPYRRQTIYAHHSHAMPCLDNGEKVVHEPNKGFFIRHKGYSCQEIGTLSARPCPSVFFFLFMLCPGKQVLVLFSSFLPSFSHVRKRSEVEDRDRRSGMVGGGGGKSLRCACKRQAQGDVAENHPSEDRIVGREEQKACPVICCYEIEKEEEHRKRGSHCLSCSVHM